MDTKTGNKTVNNVSNSEAAVSVTLEARPERQLIRPSGSLRHIDYQLQVSELAAQSNAERLALNLALVLDRSGSMQGDKLATAKRAALAVIDRLDERDRIAVVVFDDRIDVVQKAAAATTDVKAQVSAALAEIEARATTALHEGWLTGCRTIAGDAAPSTDEALPRCFLLTDGLANVGETDPEQIASEAAGVREQGGIGTSTFGIGDDYDESLLGPMAVAGGGQFHNLRTAGEIASTFIGELGDLLAVAASQVRLEVEVTPGVTVEAVSEYWTSESTTGASRWSMLIGDLLGGEERHIVVRFGFPPKGEQDGHIVRARVVWSAAGGEHSTNWQEVRFSYADYQVCDAEHRDASVMHWVGLHHAKRAMRQATELYRQSDVDKARQRLRKVARRISEYAGSDADLRNAIGELTALEEDLAARRLSAARSKEIHYTSQRISRGQKDFRNS